MLLVSKIHWNLNMLHLFSLSHSRNWTTTGFESIVLSWNAGWSYQILPKTSKTLTTEISLKDPAESEGNSARTFCGIASRPNRLSLELKHLQEFVKPDCSSAEEMWDFITNFFVEHSQLETLQRDHQNRLRVEKCDCPSFHRASKNHQDCSCSSVSAGSLK